MMKVIVENMPTLQLGSDGKYILTIPKTYVIGKGWKKGDIIAVAIVDEINRPQPGDLFLRRDATRSR